MVAKNSVDNYSGNISVGTSVFAMIVLDNNLSKVYKELDLVTTPECKPVSMVHFNNCNSNFNRWINLFEDFASLFNMNISREELFEQCLKNSLNGDSDAGGLLSYEYLSGEHITNLDKGLPMLLIKEDSNF
ncbi:MAG: FGGY-family carbohydrate kinase, partial [Mycoplasmatales bacterium]